MRVISQDGTIDIPYELSAVTIGHKVDLSKFNINIRSKLLDERPCIVATYSTKAKAIKAMEMLREKYLQYISLQGGESAFVQAVFQPNYWVLPKVFQFPQDDEIEV